MNTWGSVADVLVTAGVSRVYGLPDDDMLAAHALEERGVDFAWTASQRSAVNMAVGAALASQTTQVCVIGRGPAVAVALPGILEAAGSGASVVILASGTSTRHLLSRAFQDAPSLEVVAPLVKWAVRVPDGAPVGPVVAAGLARAGAVPTGPVFIEVPDGLPEVEPAARCRPLVLADVAAAVGEAERPLVLVGGGARSANTAALLRMIEGWGAASMTTASGRGTVSEGSQSHLGLAGLYMTEPVAELFKTVDLVIAVGTRLEATAVEPGPCSARWLQVNAAIEDIDFARPGWHTVATVDQLTSSVEEADVEGRHRHHTTWQVEVSRARERSAVQLRNERSTCARVIATLSTCLEPGMVLVQENGLHDIWGYLSPLLQLPDGTRVVVPSEQTTLGVGVAAAAGIAAAEDCVVVCVCGDGAFATFAADLPFLVRHHLRLLYIVLDDGGYGWLDRQAQQSSVRLDLVDGAVGRGALPVGVSCGEVDEAGDVEAAIVQALERAKAGTAYILQVRCEADDVPPVLLNLHGEEG